MRDQAHRLRRLVSRVATSEHGAVRGKQLVLTGCKGGVGTTTLLINLAVALRKQEQRVLVVDANPSRGDVATLLRLSVASDLEDVIEGRHAIRQILLGGPMGIEVLPSFGARDGAVGAKVLQLIRQLDLVAHTFDWILIDAGCCPATAELLWPTSDQAIVVTTTDYVAITDAYALIKAMHRKRAASNVASIINRATPEQPAHDAQRRLIESCRRFLRLDLAVLAGVPACEHIADAANTSGRPAICSQPHSPAMQAIGKVADQLASVDMGTNNFNPVPLA